MRQSITVTIIAAVGFIAERRPRPGPMEMVVTPHPSARRATAGKQEHDILHTHIRPSIRCTTHARARAHERNARHYDYDDDYWKEERKEGKTRMNLTARHEHQHERFHDNGITEQKDKLSSF